VRVRGGAVDRTLQTIAGAAATVTGRQLVGLASAKGISAISLDRPVKLASYSLYSSTQQWPYAVGAQKVWSAISSGTLSRPPAIAFVDSGIQNRLDFTGRLLQQVSISGERRRIRRATPTGMARSSRGSRQTHCRESAAWRRPLRSSRSTS
jgi:hypothetical protein